MARVNGYDPLTKLRITFKIARLMEYILRTCTESTWYLYATFWVSTGVMWSKALTAGRGTARSEAVGETTSEGSSCLSTLIYPQLLPTSKALRMAISAFFHIAGVEQTSMMDSI